jgi:putative chitinase
MGFRPVSQLGNPGAFFAKVRTGLLGPTLSEAEVDGCNAILAATQAWPLAWTAYALGTAYHETAHTLQPVREIGGPDYFRRMYDPLGNRPQVAARLGNVRPGDGAVFPGRGYVQLTGRRNYQVADDALQLGGQLLTDPDLALRPDIAAQVMERGMRLGWFSGRKLADFLPANRAATRAEFIAARRIINGTDRAELIADDALDFQTALALAA